jgi:hypothetical protein
MRPMRQILIAASLAVCAFVAGGMPSAAVAQPSVEVVPVDVTFTDMTCRFPLTEHLEGHTVTVTFRDDSGAEVRRLRQVVVTGTLTNPISGATARVHEAALFERQSAGGAVTEARQSGLRLLVTVPGVGRVLLDAGLVVTEAGSVVQVAGPHQLRDGDVGAMCAALS